MALKLGGHRAPEGEWFLLWPKDNGDYDWVEEERANEADRARYQARVKVLPVTWRLEKRIERLMFQESRKLRGRIKPGLRKDLEKRAAADELLTDWDGIDLGDTPQDYTPELGAKAFDLDPAFFYAVRGMAQSLSLEELDEPEDEAEQLGNGSGGSSSGARSSRKAQPSSAE